MSMMKAELASRPIIVPKPESVNAIKTVVLYPSRLTMDAPGKAIHIPITEKIEESQPVSVLLMFSEICNASIHGNSLFCATAMATPLKTTASVAVHTFSVCVFFMDYTSFLMQNNSHPTESPERFCWVWNNRDLFAFLRITSIPG